MSNSSTYPYWTYVPNKVTAACVCVLVSVSLVAWLVQSVQSRFRPFRLSFLLLISHLTILTDLIIRAAAGEEHRNSKYVFQITSTLFLIGQRMIIVSNTAFLTEVLQKKSRFSRVILISTMLGVLSSGLLMAPANALSFNPNSMHTSYLFRILSASLLLTVTLIFYPVWYWSGTVKAMRTQAMTLITVSSVACVIVAIFVLIQSLPTYYEKISANEGWFYGLQMTPIIGAHCTWSMLHPKRTLLSYDPLLESSGDVTSTKEQILFRETTIENT